MKETKALLEEFAANRHQARLQEIYVDKGVLDYQNGRYQEAIRKYEELYGAGEAEIYSAAGRSEVGGNHTDHQHGRYWQPPSTLTPLQWWAKLTRLKLSCFPTGIP